MKKSCALLLCLILALTALWGCEVSFVTGPTSSHTSSSSSTFDSSTPDSSVTDSSTSDSSIFDSSSIEDSSSAILQHEIYFTMGEEIEIEVGETLTLEYEIEGDYYGDVLFESTSDCIRITSDGVLTALFEGETIVSVIAGDKSDQLYVIAVEPVLLSDPYENVTQAEFYANYTPATSYLDSYYRTLHNFMSGSIEVPDVAPVIADNRPISADMYVKNNRMQYSKDGNTYYVYNQYGEIQMKIFKGGAYITLEEVAAYMFAFGEIPANYVSNKKPSPSLSPWGKYLRANHSQFIGDTSRYPYEPELPNISGCGGTYQYYEMDIGSVGYNNGVRITRGACRLVYARLEAGKLLTDYEDKYVFYTYNHYYDFQEYLNYYNGWGEKFGSKNNTISPTDYPQVFSYDFSLIYAQSPVAIFDKYLN